MKECCKPHDISEDKKSSYYFKWLVWIIVGSVLAFVLYQDLFNKT